MRNSMKHCRLPGLRSAYISILMLGGTALLPSCSDNLLTGTPEWLGTSIYDELQQRGDYKTTLALIDDPELQQLNYHQLLKLTGSMTFFVANDSAWQRYLATKGVTDVTQLPVSQKKNLIKGSMVNNAYLIELLSNLPGNPPSEGGCMRRESRVDITDSIPVMPRATYPAVNPHRVDGNGNIIDYWAHVRNRDSILIYKDNSATPMVHFLPDFMMKNDLTSVDLYKLTNGAASDVEHTSYINGKRVVKQDITCQNGYIHLLEAVPEQLDNMAEIIHKKPQFSIFSKLLDRFSYPQFLATTVIGEKEDSVFVKRYFNSGGNNHSLTTIKETETAVSNLLSFDPGWNRYIRDTDAENMPYSEDAGAMFVPTNKWMEEYISPTGKGSAIGVKYGLDWDNVPDDIVMPFLNNSMNSSFVSSTPSKFEYIINTASEPMGIVITDVDSCFMACNGVVYQLNKTFIAPEHQSVIFPSMLRADEDMSVIYKSVTDARYNTKATLTPNWTLNDYKTYLTSMACTYSYLAPNDQAFAKYIDPFSIYEGKPIGYMFYIDPTNMVYPVYAKAFEAELKPNGQYELTDIPATRRELINLSLFNNRLQDVLDNIIVVHGQRGAQVFRPTQRIYLNKAGNPIEVQFNGNEVVGIAGSEAMAQKRFIRIDPAATTDLRRQGNGMAYVLPEIPATTFTSPYAAIMDTVAHPEYIPFAELLAASSFIGAEISGHPSMDYAINLLGNFNYTIYIPQADAVMALEASGKLPTWDLYDEWSEYPGIMADYADTHPGTYTDAQLDSIQDLAEQCKATIATTIENFIRYHIQDGSVFLGGVDTVSIFETAAIDAELSRFHRLYVSASQQSIAVRDMKNNTVHVVKNDDSNRACRQYLFIKNNRHFYTTAPTVVHLIDGALSYSDKQFIDPTTFPKPVYPQDLVRTTGKKHAHTMRTNIPAQWKPQHAPKNEVR